MVRLQRDSKGQILSLSDQAVLAVGGEARIYEVPGNPALVAKLYHKPSLERASKLRVMVANPPSDPMAVQKHTSIAWPTDLLHLPGQPQRTVGFLMPRVVGMRRVIDFFNPKTRREQCPLFNYFYLHRTARNLAIAVRAIHERGYVIGDINESNVLVSDRALVTLVDTDSFQVWDMGKGRMYRCRVGKPEFTPPELQGRCFADLDRETYHDLFGMGVILFQLLMEGTHPFAGAYKGPGDPPPYEQRIGAGHFPHSVTAHVPYSPGPIAPHFAWLHPMLQHLFGRCFQEGHLDPT
jgi:DNA-binding helix-hairpin-helix protein with protein kinase domain